MEDVSSGTQGLPRSRERQVGDQHFWFTKDRRISQNTRTFNFRIEKVLGKLGGWSSTTNLGSSAGLPEPPIGLRFKGGKTSNRAEF